MMEASLVLLRKRELEARNFQGLEFNQIILWLNEPEFVELIEGVKA